MIARLAQLTLLLALLAGCRTSPPVTAPRAPAATPRPAPVMEEGLSSPARTCEGRAPEVFAFATASDLICADHHRECAGRIELEVLNCTAEPVGLQFSLLHAGERRGEERRYEVVNPVPALGSFSYSAVMQSEGGYTVRIAVERGDRTELSPPIALEIHNPARDQAIAACAACHGRWGREGMAGIEGCNCRPADAGKACRDGDECQGECLADRLEIIHPPQPVRCDRTGHCTASLGAGRLVGHCSDRMAVFGCHSRIARGASKEPPSPLPILATVCVD